MKQNRAGESQKILYIIALNFLSINAMLQIYQSLVPLIMQRDFLVSEWKIGVLTGVVNVMVCMLLLGLNKIRPKVGGMVLAATILSVALVMTPFSIKRRSTVFFMILVYIGMMAISYIKVLANDFTLRVAVQGKENSAMALTKIMSTLGALMVLLLMYALSDEHVFYVMVLLNIMTVGGVFCVRKSIYQEREEIGQGGLRKGNKEVRGKYVKPLVVILCCYTVYDAMLNTFSRYATKVWNMKDNDFAIYQSVCLVAAFVAYIPVGKISNEHNQKRVTTVGLSLMIISLIIMGLQQSFQFLTVICLALVGVGWAAIAVNLVPILVYGVTLDEASTLVGYYSVMSNISLIIAPIISGIVLEYLSYRALYPLLVGVLLGAVFVLAWTKCESECE